MADLRREAVLRFSSHVWRILFSDISVQKVYELRRLRLPRLALDLSLGPNPLWVYKFLGEETKMDEKTLIGQWNTMRGQIIQSQVGPALVLIAITVLSSLHVFHEAPDAAKYLALGVAAATGLLATISQYAAIREGEALLIDLKKVANPSALSAKIAESRGLLSLSAISIVGLDLAIFALVVWAVLGK